MVVHIYDELDQLLMHNCFRIDEKNTTLKNLLIEKDAKIEKTHKDYEDQLKK